MARNKGDRCGNCEHQKNCRCFAVNKKYGQTLSSEGLNGWCQLYSWKAPQRKVILYRRIAN